MPHIKIARSWQLPERLATPESIFLNRRQVLAGLGLTSAIFGLGGRGRAAETPVSGQPPVGLLEPAVGRRFADRFPAPRNAKFTLGRRELTPEEITARYNNFYEFSTNKVEVWRLAQQYRIDSWRVEVRGLVRRPRTLDLDDLFKRFPLEERLYRFRCVERWAMQVAWTGFPLRLLIDQLEPLSSARFVRFVSFQDAERLPGQRSTPWYPWPYFEGLRLDEARHELALVVVGAYGHALPMQNGAPWRLALPWKYGYKGPKSIVAIEFTSDQPETFWHQAVPNEYGFFSNIDPGKPHPRWSQAEERDIGTDETRPTLPYGGYAEQVASLYKGDEF